jgi:hypothetical protein
MASAIRSERCVLLAGRVRSASIKRKASDNDLLEALRAVARGGSCLSPQVLRAVINELCAAYELQKQFKLLKRAQQFTVNVFPNVLERLQRDHAVHAVQEGTGVLYLEGRWYSDEFGLNAEGTEGIGFEYA